MMRRISMEARDELVAVLAGHRGKRGRILHEFAAVTGYHRKHTMRPLTPFEFSPILFYLPQDAVEAVCSGSA
jgi:hypothetical protein